MSRKPENPTGFPTLQYRVLPKGYGDNMEEVWKDIAGYEGLYQVSTLGRIKSCDRTIETSLNVRKYAGKIIRQQEHKGYLSVMLSNTGIQERLPVHRLVAKAFIPNLNNLSEVNHKDENTKNNCVDNLEWCNRLYNANYGTALERMAKKRSVAVAQYDINGKYLNSYKSTREAARALGKNSNGNIANCLKGKVKTAYGYIWKYKEAE